MTAPLARAFGDGNAPTFKSVSPMTDWESKIGLYPVEELLAERDTLVKKVSTLRAKYGNFGTHEALRKIELAKLRGIIRAQATKDGRKVTNDQIDDEAHASGLYIDFIITATNERATWIELENLIEGINDTLMRGQAVARFASSELFLTPRTG